MGKESDQDEEISVGAYADMMQSFGSPLICVAMMRSDLRSMAMTRVQFFCYTDELRHGTLPVM